MRDFFTTTAIHRTDGSFLFNQRMVMKTLGMLCLAWGMAGMPPLPYRPNHRGQVEWVWFSHFGRSLYGTLLNVAAGTGPARTCLGRRLGFLLLFLFCTCVLGLSYGSLLVGTTCLYVLCFSLLLFCSNCFGPVLVLKPWRKAFREI